MGTSQYDNIHNKQDECWVDQNNAEDIFCHMDDSNLQTSVVLAKQHYETNLVYQSSAHLSKSYMESGTPVRFQRHTNNNLSNSQYLGYGAKFAIQQTPSRLSYCKMSQATTPQRNRVSGMGRSGSTQSLVSFMRQNEQSTYEGRLKKFKMSIN